MGTGKTLLCRALRRAVRGRPQRPVINPYLSGAELVGAILDDLGVARAGSTHGELMAALPSPPRRRGRGPELVVIVDEAQQMSVEALEQIRILSTIEMPGKKLLQIVLVGQPELLDKLGRRSSISSISGSASGAAWSRCPHATPIAISSTGSGSRGCSVRSPSRGPRSARCTGQRAASRA